MIAEIAGMGARSPLGLSSLQVATAVRARKLEPRTVPLLDRHGHEMGIAVTGGHGEHRTGFERIVSLAAPPLVEALRSAELDEVTAVPAFVCLAEPGRPDDDARYEEEFIAALASESGCKLDLAASKVVRRGHAAFSEALALAKLELDRGAAAVVVGGVDSYYHRGVLRSLDQSFRLHGLHSEDGFVPSEGAAFLVLVRAKAHAKRDSRRVSVLSIHSGDEPSARDESIPNVAGTMTELVLRAIEAVGPPSWVLTDENGESHRESEWSKVSLRLLRDVPRTTWVWDTGDVGAASGPLFAVVMARQVEIGVAPHSNAMIALHSDGGARGVVVIGAGHE